MHPQACVAGLLAGGLDPRDAGANSLLGEAAGTLKSVYSKCGDEFAAHLCALLPTLGLGLGLEAQQQLVGHVRGSDAKGLKEYLRLLVSQAPGAPGTKPNAPAAPRA